MLEIKIFQEEKPTNETYWRSINLFGKNSASYKFSMAKSLLKFVQAKKEVVTLDELAVPFSNNICEHLKHSPRQCTNKNSKFLDACKNFNEGNLEYDELISTTTKLGFNNVVDAFHNVAGEETKVKFYKKDYFARTRKIILTDQIFELEKYANMLNKEVDARWNLVENAWGLGISKNMLMVKYDEDKKLFYIEEMDKVRRVDITSSRSALNGYQKGKCFYCFDDISIIEGASNLCDVDHFFPHTLQKYMLDINLNGVWNLVLTCPHCNRGQGGKFEKIPKIKYLERLNKRNEFLISSHHPLKETIMMQTGKDVQKRINFLKQMNKEAISYIINTWETENKGEEIF